jgi:adenylate kinase family enzyme
MKTVIIGNSGSGKTWLAGTMSSLTSTLVIHLDDIFWEPGGFDRKRSTEAVSALIAQAKRQEHWIVEGVFGELAQQFLSDASRLIWLDPEWSTCRERLMLRGSESKKHLNREQSKEGLMQLLKWAANYYDRTDMRSYHGHKTMFDAFGGTRFRLRSTDEVTDFVRDIQHSAAVGRESAPLS